MADVINTSHFNYNGPKTERVANGSHPINQIALHTNYMFISGRNNRNYDGDIQDYSPQNNQIIHLSAGHSNQPNVWNTGRSKIIRVSMNFKQSGGMNELQL